MDLTPFIDKQGLVIPSGENGILYSAELASLTPEFTVSMAQRAISSQYYPHCKILGPIYMDRFYPADNDKNWSRDNHIGVVSLSKLRGLSYHNKWLWWDCWRRLMPWDNVYFLFIRDDLFHYLSLPFLPILSLYMIVTVLFHTYKNGVLDTSGAMLVRLMLNTVNMPLTKNICDYIVNKRLGGWRFYSYTYFGALHVITQLLNEKGL